MDIKLPEDVKYIMDKLDKFDYSTYIVGGCVRDSIMKVKPKDWDITTDATPEEVSNIFKNDSNCKVIPTGEKYGTMTILINNDKYEITTFRSDGEYSDGRRPDNVTFGTSIIDDLSRRDLTINAIAYNELVGLVDPYNGLNDINNHIIRFVGDTEKRIKEDALRILRAIRFLIKYKFTTDSTTINILNNNKQLLNKVSKERIHEEFIQIINNLVDTTDSVKYKVKDFAEIFAYILERADRPYYSWENITWLEPLFGKKDYLYKISRIFLDDQLYEAEIWLRKYKFSSEEVKKVISFIKMQRYVDKNPIDNEINADIWIRKMIKNFSCNFFDLYTFFDSNKDITDLLDKNYNQPTRLSDLAINGDDLIVLGYRQSNVIGETLNKLLDWVIINPELNNKDKLTELAIKWRV